MPVNLLNEYDLNTYLTQLIGVPKTSVVSVQQLQDIDFILQHKNDVAKIMVAQWIKHRMRHYLVEKADVPFLKKIDLSYPNLPQWAIDNLASGRTIHVFDSSKVDLYILEKIYMIDGFLTRMATSYIDKQLAVATQENTPVKLRLEYLKTSNQYQDFEETYQQALVFEKISKNKTSYRYRLKQKKQSEIGTQKIMDLSDGYYVVRLINTDGLDFEAKYMNHCVGNGTYNHKIDSDDVCIYSIRDSRGEPHVTIEVYSQKYIDTWGYVKDDVFSSMLRKEGNTKASYFVRQCLGKNNKSLLSKYIPYAQQFILSQNYGFVADMKHSGLIYQDGQYYDVFHLPKGFVVKGDLDLSGLQLTELPDLSTVTVNGTFDCSQNNLKSLKGAPRHVGKNFICFANQLKTLDGGPESVGGDYICSENCLVSLKGISGQVGGNLNCCGNQIVSWKHYPQSFNRILFDYKLPLRAGDSTSLAESVKKQFFAKIKNFSYDDFHAVLFQLQQTRLIKSIGKTRDAG